VFEPYGFQMRYLDAGAELTEQVQSYRESGAARDISVVVVNAQHNPTGANWSQQETRALLELAVDLGAAILIDDAYFGFCDRGAVPEPTSAVRILLDLLSQSATTVPWLAVRSLGKQFHCNGWGLGSVVASPDFLDWLVNESRPHHTYNYGVHLQWAMAEWLSDEAAVAEYLCREQAGYRTRRAAVLAGLVSCGVPADRIVTGPAAPYLLFPVPAEAGLSSYLRRSVLEAGVLLSDAWPLGRKADRPDTGYVRMYLGPDLERLSAAIGRLRAAGLL
jgi:N-succinyldiaminopimelate aminotransferase